jgi:hypothetical protein
MNLVGIIGGGWALGWFAVSAALHFRLANELEKAGRLIPWSRIASRDVEDSYVTLCDERGVDGWPKVRGVLISAAIGFPGWILLMVGILS